jgi:hypothetical protein
MNVSELGHESFVVADVVIIGTFQPKVRHIYRASYLFARLERDDSLEHLHEAWHQSGGRFTHQEMDMLRHHNVSENVNLETLARLFQSSQERIFHVHLG